MNKEEIYIALIACYKCTPDQISRMTPAQQLVMFKAVPKAPDLNFDSLDDYYRWKNGR